MNKKLNKAFNEQINMELASAYLYKGMSEWLQRKSINGAAHWMDIQVLEELEHAKGLIKYVQMHDGEVEYPAIAAASCDYASALDVFEKALAHEKEITQSINKLVDLSNELGDRASAIFLDWYIMEQVEEEENQRDNVDAIKFAGDDKAALMAVDSGMGQREFHAPRIPYIE